MKILRILPLLALCMVSQLVGATQLKVGDPAPHFTLEGSDGKHYNLASYKGRQAVVLAWYPMAYTRGCTIECKSLTEKGHLIQKFDTVYFMASVDPIDKNRGFAKQEKVNFPLLSDPDKSIAKAYGVLSPKGYAKRVTFVIGKDGKILHIDKKVKPRTAAEDIAATLARLKVDKR